MRGLWLPNGNERSSNMARNGDYIICIYFPTILVGYRDTLDMNGDLRP